MGEAADATPGKNIMNMTNPMSKLIVLDFVKYFDTFIIAKLSRLVIYSQTPSGWMIEPVGYSNELHWLATPYDKKLMIPELKQHLTTFH